MLFSMILQLFSVFITRRRSENSIETAAVTVTVQGHYDVQQAPVVFGIHSSLSQQLLSKL